MSEAEQSSGSIAAIVLAAGRSSRMDAHKLLLPLGGRPLIAHSVAAVCASDARPILVLVGRSADEIERSLPPGPYTVIVNERFAEGMGTTLALAVTRLPPDVIGALILLADQPLMSTMAINAVLKAARLSPDNVAMGEYAGRTGHPVYLPCRLFPQVAALSGDQGARTILAAERRPITRIPLGDPDMALDVDTPEDYARAQALFQSSENRPS